MSILNSMKSPFGENFEEQRKDSSIEIHDVRTKEEIKEQLLREKLQHRSYLKDIFKGILTATYLIFRSQAPISYILKFVYVDKILWLSGILLLIPCFILGIIIISKSQTNSIKYSINEKSFFGFIEHDLYEPYDYEEKPKPIITFKKLLVYILCTELAISSFFLIDYLFGL